MFGVKKWSNSVIAFHPPCNWASWERTSLLFARLLVLSTKSIVVGSPRPSNMILSESVGAQVSFARGYQLAKTRVGAWTLSGGPEGCTAEVRSHSSPALYQSLCLMTGPLKLTLAE